jgi:5-methylcytosine-specific restriction enzyme A
MPTAPRHPCPTPGCGALVVAGHCAQHTDTGHRWDARRPDITRVRGRQLQARRRRLFQRQPLCEPCQAAGRLVLATIRDHRLALAEGGTEDETNEQAICAACHAAKTQREAQRGRR